MKPLTGARHLSAYQGQPCIDLFLLQGDRVRIAQHGAHILSWVTSDGRERLYLSPQASIDGASPIRGGVPLCFPQFNERALGAQALPKHGFARTQPWVLREVEQTADRAHASFSLDSNAQTLALWPNSFSAVCTVELEPDRLCVKFAVRNTGDVIWRFAVALHTYLRVDDIGRTDLEGLKAAPYWDAVLHQTQPDLRLRDNADSLRFASEIDRVYAHPRTPLMLKHLGGWMQIEQSPTLPEVVVWNPGAVKCASLADMPPEGFKHMLCVEAARIQTPQILLPTDTWRGWQSFRALPRPAPVLASAYSPL